MTDLLSIDTVFLTVLGYPLSYVEFAGTVLYLLSVWLIARRNVLTWPTGIVSVLLYMLVFYQVRLYADTLEQLYYLGVCAYGWWYWSKSSAGAQEPVPVGFSSRRALVAWGAGTATVALAFGATLTRVHVWLPALFPEPASFPYLDALTTVMSLSAMWLLARRRVESWVYWIVVDVIAIGLYYVKEVRFISLLYVILLGLAVRGLSEWWRAAAPVAPLPAHAA